MFKIKKSKPEGLEELLKARKYIIDRFEHFKTELSIIERRIKQEERWDANAFKNTND